MTENVPAEFEIVAEIARRMKRELVAESGNDPDEEACDLRNFVVVVRAGQQVGLVYVAPGPEGTREACYWAAALLRPHELFLVADARMRSYPTEEGVPDVQKGEYERDWRAGKREGITECLILQRIPLIGNPSMVMYPYLREGTKIRWLKSSLRESSELGGAVLDYARKGFRDANQHVKGMRQTQEYQALFASMSEAEQDHHLDRACARIITTQMDGLVFLFDGEASFLRGEEIPVG